MSILTSHITTNPFGKEDECALFTVEDIQEQFTIFDVTTVGLKYTFNCWLKSDSDGRLTIHGTTISTTPQWQQYTVTFIAEGTNLVIDYDAAGAYYIYHPKLELGNLVTDWTPAPEDAEDAIKNAIHEAEDAKSAAEKLFYTAQLDIDALRNVISTLVVDENGTSLMTQTGSGWVFSMGRTTEELRDLNDKLRDSIDDIEETNDQIEALKQTTDPLVKTASYVHIDESGSQPYIILGQDDNEFKVVITNTDIRFLEGSHVPAYISNQSLHIKKAVIEEELQQGGFVWTVRSNGNMGLVWKGGGV